VQLAVNVSASFSLLDEWSGVVVTGPDHHHAFYAPDGQISRQMAGGHVRRRLVSVWNGTEQEGTLDTVKRVTWVRTFAWNLEITVTSASSRISTAERVIVVDFF
jgi:hypothetical protein